MNHALIHLLKAALVAATLLLQPVLSPAAAQSTNSRQRIVYTVEFRKFPTLPVCRQTVGAGTLKVSQEGRKYVYNLGGYNPKSKLVCTFENGNSFDLNVGFLFDEYIQRAESNRNLRAGASGKIRTIYKFSSRDNFTLGDTTFSAKRFKIKMPSDGLRISKAMLPNHKFATGRWDTRP